MAQSTKSNQGILRTSYLRIFLSSVIIFQLILNPHGFAMKDDQRKQSIDTTKALTSLDKYEGYTSSYYINKNNNICLSPKMASFPLRISTTSTYTPILTGRKNNYIYGNTRGEMLCIWCCKFLWSIYSKKQKIFLSFFFYCIQI